MASNLNREKGGRERPLMPQLKRAVNMAQPLNPTILFVSALQEETDPLWCDSRFSWSQPQEASDSIWYRSCDFECSGGIYRLVSAAACEMGLTATTILTAKLVLRWNPVLVIGFGICAGMKGQHLSIGDVVISTKALLYQFGRKVDGQLFYEKREEALHTSIETLTRLDRLEVREHLTEFSDI